MKPKISLFYISSRGSSASTWLAKMLSRHPQVVCFRSTRGFPPYAPGVGPQMSADAFMEGLLECTQATLGEKIFGSIHGYHGLLAKEPCEKRGGIFSYIIRHPVSRIHSAYIVYLYLHYYKKFGIPVANKDIHDRVCSSLLADSDLMRYTEVFKPETRQVPHFGPLRPIKRFAKKVLSDYVIKSLAKQMTRFSQKGQYIAYLTNDKTKDAPDERLHAGIRFVSLTNEFLRFDSVLFKECSLSYGIKMEEMVKSSEYFKNHLWQRVAPQLDVTDTYLESIFHEPRFNVHRDKVLSPIEIWRSWPTGMKEAFLKYFECYNMSAICKAFDYDISFL